VIKGTHLFVWIPYNKPLDDLARAVYAPIIYKDDFIAPVRAIQYHQYLLDARFKHWCFVITGNDQTEIWLCCHSFHHDEINMAQVDRIGLRKYEPLARTVGMAEA
jgi:hypothetical protein